MVYTQKVEKSVEIILGKVLLNSARISANFPTDKDGRTNRNKAFQLPNYILMFDKIKFITIFYIVSLAHNVSFWAMT